METYDLAVIGGGSAGLTAAIVGGRVRAKTILIDIEEFGGDCLAFGCVPSKAVIASAKAAHIMSRAAEYGMAPVEVKADIVAVLKRMSEIREAVGKYEKPEVLEEDGVETAFGGARFISPTEIEIGGFSPKYPEKRRIKANYSVIATGSKAVAPKIPGLAEAGYLDHVSFFSQTKMPKTLVVIGGGPIGCELGQTMARLGTKVTILQGNINLLKGDDSENTAILVKCLREEGITVNLGARVTSVKTEGGQKVVTADTYNGRVEYRCDEILVAAGRRPIMENLNLKAAGVATTEKGITVDDSLATSAPNIFAAGDVTGGPQFTHWAEYEGRIAARNALFRGSDKRSYRILPWVTFTEPEVARVGMLEEEAKKLDKNALVYRFPYSRIDRALCEGDSEGQIKVIVDKNEKILGVHAVGPHAGEVLPEWVLAMEKDVTLREIGSAIHAYPTFVRVNRRVGDLPFLTKGLTTLQKLAAKFKPRP
jgi:pyruvate/2-oxoglutarate dehydrogenase complex dihydrolipoamide dehydrogenase (E3) component